MSREWRSGWCSQGSHVRCVGVGPSPSKPDGVVRCACDCHKQGGER